VIYLYIKKCAHCDLKYFGKTTRDNPESYTGSGLYWIRHLKEHNSKQLTLEIYSFDDQNSAIKFATDFSEKHDIANSEQWANLMPERVVDGFYRNHREDSKKKMRGPRNPRTQQTKEKMSKRQKGSGNNNFKGWYVTPWGKFDSAHDAVKFAPFEMPATTLIDYCKLNRPVKKKNKYNIPVGIPLSDLGYNFIEKSN